MASFLKRWGSWVCLVLALGAGPAAVDAQQRSPALPFSLRVAPSFAIPVGESTSLFTPGGGAALCAELGLTESALGFLSARLEYELSPFQASRTLSLASAELGGGLGLVVVPRWLTLRLLASGGGALGVINETGFSGFVPCFTAGLDAQVMVSPQVSIGLGAAYRNYLGLQHGVVAAADVSIFLSGTEARRQAIEQSLPARPEVLGGKPHVANHGIDLEAIELGDILPVFYKYYDEHPVGAVTLVNREKEAIGDIKMSFLVKQFMDSPKDCPAPQEMQPGESSKVEVLSLFADRILEVTEATKVAADITWEYRLKGVLYKGVRTVTLRLQDRNAMSWDDDRRVAAFVTAKDPRVMTFSKNIVGALKDRYTKSLDEKLLTAMGVYQALGLHGVRYVSDPASAVKSADRRKASVDYLQFPRQTLEFRSGDCDDLSILYSALLESLGIETAFITVPGHIFMAFAVDVPEDGVPGAFSYPADVILRGKAWVPVEVTLRTEGFLKAWQEGAREWREAEEKGTAGFFPTHEAWQEYEPVALPGTGPEIAPPPAASLVPAFVSELARFVDRELSPRVSALQKEIREKGSTPALRNRLGILYGRYGKLDEAERELQKALGAGDYVPALLNMGNLKLLRGDQAAAQGFFERASAREPSNPTVVLAVARTNYAQERYDLARQGYERLRELNPSLAERYSYLGETGQSGVRAAEAGSIQGGLTWAE
jgi:tetratricopeptide (TPR) repeat protein